ncbi:MAG: adenosine kinase [Planctomycetes bacterium]|nr:adenosine kinase [Planctomycetota bacterium]
MNADSLATTEPVHELFGVGSPLVDLVVSVDEAFLRTHVQGQKGGMQLVDAEIITAIVADGGIQPVMAAGGAASNTTVGAANLGIRSAFIGSCGADDYAQFYRSALKAQGCHPQLVEHAELPTGRALSLVTPDAERTMRTCLGAAAALDPAYFTPAVFQGAKVVMLEGYTLFNRDLTRAVARAAKEADCELALDLASLEVVAANREVILELLDGFVDLVFANVDEAKAWNSAGPEAALEDLARHVPIAVVKLGKEGALIQCRGQRVHVAAEQVEAIDTTGAGDSWAAGFLAGHLRGLPIAQCGRLGALAGAAVVQVMGAQVPREKWLGVKGYLDAWA